MALGHVFTRRIQRFLLIGGDQRAQRRRRGVLQKTEIRATAAGYRRARTSTAHQVLGGVVARDRVASPADNRRRARETRRARRGQHAPQRARRRDGDFRVSQSATDDLLRCQLGKRGGNAKLPIKA